jgi:hypothetical protein
MAVIHPSCAPLNGFSESNAHIHESLTQGSNPYNLLIRMELWSSVPLPLKSRVSFAELRRSYQAGLPIHFFYSLDKDFCEGVGALNLTRWTMHARFIIVGPARGVAMRV